MYINIMVYSFLNSMDIYMTTRNDVTNACITKMLIIHIIPYSDIFALYIRICIHQPAPLLMNCYIHFIF